MRFTDFSTQTVCAPCELCRKVIRMGPVYEGRYVDKHDAIVCNTCWTYNRNSWRAEHAEAVLRSNLNAPSIREIEEQRRAIFKGPDAKAA
jgi:hypothetical protein